MKQKHFILKKQRYGAEANPLLALSAPRDCVHEKPEQDQKIYSASVPQATHRVTNQVMLSPAVMLWSVRNSYWLMRVPFHQACELVSSTSPKIATNNPPLLLNCNSLCAVQRADQTQVFFQGGEWHSKARKFSISHWKLYLGVLLVVLRTQLESGWAHCRPTAENHRHLRRKNTSSWRPMPTLLVLVLSSSRNTPAESTTQSAISLVNLISTKSIIPQLTKIPCFAVCFPTFRGVSLVQFSAHRTLYKPQPVRRHVSYVQFKLRSLNEMGHDLNQPITITHLENATIQTQFLVKSNLQHFPNHSPDLWLWYSDDVRQHHGKPPVHIFRMQWCWPRGAKINQSLMDTGHIFISKKFQELWKFSSICRCELTDNIIMISWWLKLQFTFNLLNEQH